MKTRYRVGQYANGDYYIGPLRKGVPLDKSYRYIDGRWIMERYYSLNKEIRSKRFQRVLNMIIFIEYGDVL